MVMTNLGLWVLFFAVITAALSLIGLKMVLSEVYPAPILASLVVVAGILLVSVLLSVFMKERTPS